MNKRRPTSAAALAAVATLGLPRNGYAETKAKAVAKSVFAQLAEHEVRFARLNVLRKGWAEQCARPDADPAVKRLVESMLDAITLAVEPPNGDQTKG